MKRFVVLASPAGSNSWAIISPGLFPTLERARGWAKERAEVNRVAAEYTVAEIVPREVIKWEGADDSKRTTARRGE